jgi:hypothetical protein
LPPTLRCLRRKLLADRQLSLIVRQLELIGQLQQPGLSPEEQQALWVQLNAVTAKLEQLFDRA